MMSPRRVSVESLVFFLLFAVFIVFFIYFRLLPIINQTVPYTFDQGRDFLKAYEIIHDKNITLLGPTTGVEGVFHGVWWYYFLSIPYFIFQGNPIGFLLFIFFTTLIQTALFSLFLRKKFGLFPALLFFALIAVSPYFIQMSFFAISSIFVFPFLLLFFYSLYYFLEKKSLSHLFLLFLNLSFIFEAEIPTGIFMILSFLLSVFFLRQSRVFFGSFKKISYVLLGLFIPTIPRWLFEVKNEFIQTKTVFHFLSSPSFHNKYTLQEILTARFHLFLDYYLALFPDKSTTLGFLFLIVMVWGLLRAFKKVPSVTKKYVRFIFVIYMFLFLLSLFYKDNFWANYYEGLSFFYALFIAFSMIGFMGKSKRASVVPLLLILLLVFFSIKNTVNAIRSEKKIEGMKTQILVTDYIYSKAGMNDVCVRIYTPPVIPYTYNYLFTYYANHKGYRYPRPDFVNDRCFYIIEKDDYRFRIEKWRNEHVPSDAIRVEKNNSIPNVQIELWKQHAK